MIGNHVYGNHRTRGSNPLLSAKIKAPTRVLFVLVKKKEGDSKAGIKIIAVSDTPEKQNIE